MGNDSLRSSLRRSSRATGAAPGIKLIWNSTWRIEGRPGRSSRKTSGNSLTTGFTSITSDDQSFTVNGDVASSGWPFVSAVLVEDPLVEVWTLDRQGVDGEGFLSLNFALVISWFLAQKCALLLDPLTSRLCNSIPSKVEALKRYFL
ncbi:hypothetical protein Tco_1112065 [Tanacetum coccineum]|uniref:Uncharacterized protein n=1 Tax=Tanacetum coccineum TaxID=301880 RepID=A0ABQ5IQM2_9ASTR